MKVPTIGPDIAKRAFQVHGVDIAGAMVVRKRLRRSDVLAVSVDTLVKPENKALSKILTYHGVAGKLSAADFTDGS